MVKPIVDVRSCLEIGLVFVASVLSLVVLPTNHWGQFYRPSPIDVIREDGRYGMWGFCFVKAPRYIEDCESEELDFKMHKKALIAGILSVLHLVLVGMLYLPIRIVSTGIKSRAKVSGCLMTLQNQRFMFVRFGCAFLAACFALVVIVVMSSATDGPKDFKLERDWCYYVQFGILIIDVLILASSAKELVEEFDRPPEEQVRRKDVSAPTTAAPLPDDQSITNIDDFTVYSSTIATKESVYQPLKPQEQQALQNSPKPTELVHYVNEGVTVSQGGAPSIVSEPAAGRRPSSNLIEMSPSPEMNYFDESISPDGRASFISPGPPSEEGSESQFALSPEPAAAPVSPGIPPPPPPMPPGGQVVPSHDYQVPASQPVPAKAPSHDGLPKGPFGFVLPPLKFQPKNYDTDSDDVGYKSPRGEDNPAFEQQEETPQQSASPPPPPATSTPAPAGGPPPPPPPPPPPGWQPPK